MREKKKMMAGKIARKKLKDSAAARLVMAPFCIPFIKKSITS
jgi:hypothetical protein